MNRNNYSKLHQNYVPCECNRCNQYQIFKTQLNCPNQTREDYKEPFGSFSISAAVRQPWGSSCCNCPYYNENQTNIGVD